MSYDFCLNRSNSFSCTANDFFTKKESDEDISNIVLDSLGINEKDLIQKKESVHKKIINLINEESFYNNITDPDVLKALRFSQDSVDPKSRDGIDLFEVIKKQGWQQKYAIQVVGMPDQKLTALDNRRTLAVKRIVNEVSSSFFKGKNSVKLELYSHEDLLDNKGLKEVNILKNKVLQKAIYSVVEEIDLGLQENTMGAKVYYRMRLAEGNVHTDPYGFSSYPRVRVMDQSENQTKNDD